MACIRERCRLFRGRGRRRPAAGWRGAVAVASGSRRGGARRGGGGVAVPRVSGVVEAVARAGRPRRRRSAAPAPVGLSAAAFGGPRRAPLPGVRRCRLLPRFRCGETVAALGSGFASGVTGRPLFHPRMRPSSAAARSPARWASSPGPPLFRSGNRCGQRAGRVFADHPRRIKANLFVAGSFGGQESVDLSFLPG